MVQWEYLCFMIEWDGKFQSTDFGGMMVQVNPRVQAGFSALGAAGWEMVGYSEGRYCVFKRPKAA